VDKAIKLAPTVPDYWFIQGDLQIKLSRVKDGIMSYRKVIELEPEDPEIWLELAIVHSGNLEYERAFETLHEGLRWHEKNPDFYFGMSNYLLKSGQSQNACAMLEKALEMDYEGHHRMLKTFPDLEGNSTIADIIEGFRIKL